MVRIIKESTNNSLVEEFKENEFNSIAYWQYDYPQDDGKIMQQYVKRGCSEDDLDYAVNDVIKMVKTLERRGVLEERGDPSEISGDPSNLQNYYRLVFKTSVPEVREVRYARPGSTSVTSYSEEKTEELEKEIKSYLPTGVSPYSAAFTYSNCKNYTALSRQVRDAINSAVEDFKSKYGNKYRLVK